MPAEGNDEPIVRARKKSGLAPEVIWRPACRHKSEMDNEQAADKMIVLSHELRDDFPHASLIIGVVGCVTGDFDQEALAPLASSARVYGELALEVMRLKEE